MSNFNIIIGYTEAEADELFIERAHQLIREGQFPGKSFPGEINTMRLTNASLPLLFGKLNTRQWVRESVFAGGDGHEAEDHDKLLCEEELATANLIITDINKLGKKASLLSTFFKFLKKSNCAVFFLNQQNKGFNHIVLKYDGKEASILSILSFCNLFPAVAHNAEKSALISPLAFKRSQVAVEKQFVKKMAAHYGDLGFIKLPFESVSDFINFSQKNKADLLILSKADLDELPDILTGKTFHTLLKHDSPSFFVTTG